MTETDLRDARDAVNERIKGRRRRDRVVVAAAVAAAVALTAVGATALVTMRGNDNPAELAGPRGDLAAPDAEHLTGTSPTVPIVWGLWRLDNGGTVVKFDDDGTVHFDDRASVFSDPATTATYSIKGDGITVTTTADDRAGCAGTTFVMRASIAEPGSMRFVVPQTAGACAPLPIGRGTLEQVLPTSPILAELVYSQDSGWQPIAGKALLHGIWMAEGGGHVLAMEPDGDYFIAHGPGAPVDTGRWALRGTDLTLTSSDAAMKCSAGDRFVLAGLERIDPGTATIRGTVKQNVCGGAWTSATWILIPNGGR